MIKRILIAISIMLIVIIPVCAGYGCGKPAERDFNLVFKYGVTAKNELDTFKEKYTRDMISDPSVTIGMVLTEEEMDRIYSKMIEIGFFDYPDEFLVKLSPGSMISIITPYIKYYFRVEYKGKIKELRWDDEIVWQDEWLRDLKDRTLFENKEEAEKLYELITLILDIITNKEEYKELPEPKGGYH